MTSYKDIMTVYSISHETTDLGRLVVLLYLMLLLLLFINETLPNIKLFNVKIKETIGLYNFCDL